MRHELRRTVELGLITHSDNWTGPRYEAWVTLKESSEMEHITNPAFNEPEDYADTETTRTLDVCTLDHAIEIVREFLCDGIQPEPASEGTKP